MKRNNLFVAFTFGLLLLIVPVMVFALSMIAGNTLIANAATVCNIDTSLQRFVYTGTSITPTLKDAGGNAITLGGFNYTYEMCYNPDYGSCSDTKEPGLYKAHITRDEDDTYQAVDTYIEFVVTYSLTYNANTGIGEDIMDISDNDTIHKDYFGPYVEDQPNNYYFDAQAIIKQNTFTKDNYTFAFWNTKQDGTGTSYKPDDLVTLKGNTILYACYSANISGQPTKTNDYTVSVATTDTVSYIWEKETAILTPLNLSSAVVATGTKNDNGTITAALSGDVYKIAIRATGTKKLMFYTEDALSDGVVGKDNTYIYSSSGASIIKWYFITGNDQFTISNVNHYELQYTQISTETTNSIKNGSENASYRCTITSAFNAVSYSNIITPKAIAFNGGEGATGTAPSTLYQLEGRKITIPANTFTKTGYKFLGWNTDKDAKVALTFTDGKYKAENDTTFYAIWKSLEYNEDIDLTISSLTYNKKSSDISISIGDSDLTSDYKLWHYDEQTDSYVAVDTITNPGIYKLNIIIKGKSDNYYFMNTEEGALDYCADVILCGAIEYYSYTSTITAAISCDLTQNDISFWGNTSNTSEENIVLGVSISFSGLYAIYDDNGEGDSVTNMPEDTNTYLVDAPITISTTTPTRAGYKFLGWNTDNTAKTAQTFTDGKYTMTNENVTLYAIWESLAYDNAITLTITTLEYGVKASSISVTISDNKLKVSAFKLWYYDESTSKTVEVDTITTPGLYTMYVIVEGKNDAYYFVNTIEQFMNYYSQSVNVSGNTLYFNPGLLIFPHSCGVKSCDITKTTDFLGTESSTASENIVLGSRLHFNLTGYSVTYNDNVATEEITMPEDTNTYLEDAPITITTITPTRAGYKFLGWNTDNTAKTAQTFTDGKYTTKDENVVFYAIWQEKTAVTITETAQSKTYNATTQSFELKGTDKDLEDFVIKYAIHSDSAHGEGDWSTTPPTDTDNYDVKITRAEDDTYKAYEKEISKGIVINKYSIKDTDVTLCQDNFVYNGSDQSQNLTASYKNALGDTVSLLLSTYTSRANPVSEETFLDCGIYDVSFLLETDSERINYQFESTESEYFYTEYKMKKKEIVIDWAPDNYTYNGETQTITASYKDVSDEDIDLTVTIDKIFQNAGSYTATASFANYESNYKLPTIDTKNYTINPIKVTAPTEDTTVFTFDGNEKTYVLATNSLYTISNDTRTNAGSQTVTVALTDKTNYCWTNDTTTDLTFTFAIGKATTTITVDATPIIKTYGESVVIPQATTNFGEVTCDKIASELVNAGSYTITYTVAEGDNYTGDTKTVSVTINKIEVLITWAEDNYTYNGKVQTITATYKDIENTDIFLKVTTEKEFLNAGEYEATASFKNGETNYKLPSIVTKSYTIRQATVVLEEKEQKDGQQAEIIEGAIEENVVVVILKEDGQTDSAIAQNVKTAVTEDSEIVAEFDISLEKDGIKVEPIEGSKYRISLAIPPEIQGRTGYAIVSIGKNGTVQKHISTLEDNTLVFETTEFGTWAIVADEIKTSNSLPIWAIIVITIGILLILFVGFFFIWKYEFDKAAEDDAKKNSESKSTVENSKKKESKQAEGKTAKENESKTESSEDKKTKERTLKFLDPIYRPINKLFFGGKKN